jgi:hypothetical protein
VTVIDPCCGSGHFLVATFELLRRMRMEEEGLSADEATEAVLHDNLFDLELDARCTQIAAWKAAGYRPLPVPNIACSGVPLAGSLEEWTRLAGDDPRLRSALERLYHLFKNAPNLGSLINPADLPLNQRMFSADYREVEPLLERALAAERGDDPAAAVFGDAARGVLRAARLLARQYTLVATNVPYLTRFKQSSILKTFCDQHYAKSKGELATTFVERCSAFRSANGAYAIVTPQNWLSQSSYKRLREELLNHDTLNTVALLGPAAFRDMNWWAANTALLICASQEPAEQNEFAGIDASETKIIPVKIRSLKCGSLHLASQSNQKGNPDSRLSLRIEQQKTLLSEYADSVQGISPADFPRYRRCFWEVSLNFDWHFWQSSVDNVVNYGGREHILWWNGALLDAVSAGSAYIRGEKAWGKRGVVISAMNRLPCTLSTGEKSDTNVAIIVPKAQQHLAAIWEFCKSPEYGQAVRRIDQAVKVTNATLVKIPFDLAHWQRVADEAGPLPEPYSNDPTQWLFKGLPAGSTAPLQVAVAKLLGYRWPAEDQGQAEQMGVAVTAEERRLLRALGELADHDGIVCLPAVSGERPAHERLRALLATAYGDGWSVAVQDELLAQAGFAGKSLDAWLRDGFFKQHCDLFHNRPFIWQVWDGLRDGFAALVNYHRLDRARLEKLIYTCLGDWIRDRRAERDAGMAGAEGKLVAALELQKKLEAILEGEPPYDIYVRWKPLHEQPIGWAPDLNDGVRLNIRPFVTAGVLRSKFTINWNKDRGTNPDGSERLNDLHLSNEEKRRARSIADRPIADSR